MRILDRYLFRQTVSPLIFCLSGFVSLTVIIELFGHLDEILKRHIKWAVVARYYLYFTPTIAVMTLPIAVLLTITFILGNLHRHNEITAMRASGVSLPRIVAPFVVLGILAATVTFLANEYVVPPATMKYEQMKQRYFEDTAIDPSKLHENLAVLGRGNRLYYVGSYDPTTMILREVTILEHDTWHRLTKKIYAQAAHWDGRQWIFSNGVITRLDSQGNTIAPPERFEERPMPLLEEPPHFEHSEIRPELMRFTQLRDYLDQLEVTSPSVIHRLQVELAYKLSIPWTCVVMALLGVPFSLLHRGGMLTGMGMSVLLGVLYYGLLAISVALGKGGVLPPWVAVWLPHGVFLGVAGLLFWRIR